MNKIRENNLQVVLIAMIIPQITLAGAEKVVSQLACGINGKKYKVHLIIINEKKDNILQKEIDAKDVQCHFYGHKESNSIIRKIRQLKWIFKTLDELNPDIIHVNLDYYFSWIYAFIRNKKILTTFHSQPIKVKNFFTKNMFSLLEHKQLITSIFPTENNALEFSELFHTDRKGLLVISNPVDTKRYLFPERRYDKSKEIVFCFVSRFHPIKNHHMLITAFNELLKEVPDCRMVLAGDGSLLNIEKNYARNLEIDSKIDFLGEVTNIAELLCNADVCVISSRSESFSLALIESMAAGLPVIVTDVGGMRDIIKGNGIKVPSDNYYEFAKAMKKLALDSQLRKQYGTKSVELSKKYELNNILEEYKKVYDKELSNEYKNR